LHGAPLHTASSYVVHGRRNASPSWVQFVHAWHTPSCERDSPAKNCSAWHRVKFTHFVFV
jgi:hypothetical protein